MSLFGSNTSLIGLDVGSRVVKAAQLERVRQGFRSRAIAVLPRGANESPEQNAAQIAVVLERQGFLGNQVVLAAPVGKLQCEMLDLPPRTSGAPIEQIARSEVARVTKVDPTRFEMGSWDIPATSRSSGTSIIAVALRHEDADVMIDPLESHGLEVVAIDAQCWAVHRACRKLFSGDGAVAILDLGWSASSLYIADQQSILYQRILWDAGVQSLHKAVVRQHGLDDSAVELMLRAEARSEEAAATLPPLIQRYTRLLCDELRTSLAFARHRFPGNWANQLLLCGGGASLSGLAGFLGERLGLTVSIASAAQLVETENRVYDSSELPLLTSAVGLALYGQEEA
jgi:type IV pilus assembly protein PilM